MSIVTSDLSLVKRTTRHFDDAVAEARQQLAGQGFGILSEIDVSAAMKKRLNINYPRTLILGACNPPFAHQALSAVPDIVVLLPCNVVVRENDAGEVEIAAINTNMMGQMIQHPAIMEVAREVDLRLRRVLDAV
ncbi:MAG: DUF302 domain-containing protein [Magnetococcales bacterium]|nr:DUF302 domain-containing protein [Magnetococcales bacterium]